MAYNTAHRLKSPQTYHRLLDPGAYQNTNPPLIRSNKVSFLSKAPRVTGTSGKLWTHAIYCAKYLNRIPNCTSLQSNIPRFPYEALSEEDIKEILCRCGLEDPCDCDTEDETNKTICQGKVRRHMFKGRSLKPFSHNNTSSKNYLNLKSSNDSPPFYDTRVKESTAFYQGCKWSQWTSSRAQKVFTNGPGPADYDLDFKPDFQSLCDEQVRAHKRKTCKKLRFLDIIHRQNIIERRPGPATYSPILPKSPELQCIGSKAKRFTNTIYKNNPGPADHWLKRDFEVAELPEKWCHAKLPTRAPFGVNAVRLRGLREEGASPFSYSTEYKSCRLMRCSAAPFNSTAVRFTKICNDADDDEDIQNIEEQTSHDCRPIPSWQYKSKTIRMKPLTKKYNEPSPADLPQTKTEIERPINSQYSAPFYSSERRFMPWYNYISVHGKEKTPGPAYYCLEKFKCQSAVLRGPLCRTRRFSEPDFITPASNEYKLFGGIENILSTHNQKLKNNINKQHKFCWKPHEQPVKLTLKERQTKLIEQSISLLEPTNVFETKSTELGSTKSSTYQSFNQDKPKPKILRCFVYSKPIKSYF